MYFFERYYRVPRVIPTQLIGGVNEVCQKLKFRGFLNAFWFRAHTTTYPYLGDWRRFQPKLRGFPQLN